MNAVFFAIVLVAFLVGGYHQWSWVPSAADSVSPMAALGTAMVDAAGGAVTLAIGLVGMMALFLGLMKVRLRPVGQAPPADCVPFRKALSS